jgi:hypothetical protein
MIQVQVPLPRPRNPVARNDRNRAARHRLRNRYQRHSKHKNHEVQ